MIICWSIIFSISKLYKSKLNSEFSFSDLFIIKKDNVFSSLLITAEASMKSTSSALSLEYLGESILSFKRAGANLIASYFAEEIAKIIWC